MNMLSSKKAFLLSILLVCMMPGFVNAQGTPPRAIPVDQTTLQNIRLDGSQAGGALNGQFPQSGGPSFAVGSGKMASCIGASGLTNLVKSQISGSLSSIVSNEVPVTDNVLRSKDVGTLATGGISWDNLGYCMVNSLIEAIGAATVNWINSGFEGNPVFVDDPQQFFADIADIEAGRFLGEISNGFLCQPIRNVVRVNLTRSYNNSISPYDTRSQCTFSGVAGNLEQFMSGETFSWDDWFSYTQNPQNNPFGATIYGQIELDNRIARSLGTQSTLLEWGRGFLSFKDPETGKITSPGALVEGQINQRLFSGESRINMADEFDEVVNALVDQLIKIAINEVTQAR